MYSHVRTHSRATLTIQRALFKICVAQVEIEFKPNESGDYNIIELEGSRLFFQVKSPSR